MSYLFFQLLLGLDLPPSLLQSRDRNSRPLCYCIFCWKSNERNVTLLPSCGPSVVCCKYGCASGNRGSPCLSQGTVFGRCHLKMGRALLISTHIKKQIAVLNIKVWYLKWPGWKWVIFCWICMAVLAQGKHDKMQDPWKAVFCYFTADDQPIPCKTLTWVNARNEVQN